MEKLYSIEQVATAWDLSNRTIQRHIANGQLKHYKIGSRIKFSEQHLNDFLEDHEY